MRSSIPALAVALVVVAAVHPPPPAAAQPGRPATPRPRTDLDDFMEKALATRAVNRETLKQYVLNEVETVEIIGPSRQPLHRTIREFTWYVRDGMHVRSPVRFDGVEVGEADRDHYEREWIERERRRLEREKEKRKEGEKEDAETGERGSPIPVPRFVSEAYFMDFEFEPGNYYLAGRETLEGRPVLRIEYYPEQMFRDDDDKDDKEDRATEKDRKDDKEREFENRIQRQMNRTSLITLWVDPAEHQIVKYTFDNVWLDFLPGAWLVRVDDIGASMTMGQPFAGVWLPRDLSIRGRATVAAGTFEVVYRREFSDYREAEVKTRIKVPKDDVPRVPGGSMPRQEPGASESGGPFLSDEHFPPASELVEDRGQTGVGPGSDRGQTGVGPGSDRGQTGVRPGSDTSPAPGTASGGPRTQTPVIAEIRVHGNAWLSEADVIELAGIAVGQPADAAALETIERRLRESGRFETVEIRTRSRSLDDDLAVALILVVHERPGVTSMESSTGPIAGPVGRFVSRLMFMPILNYADGYGFSYGGRVSTVDLFGIGERLSVPLTWGATKRAAFEFERTFERGPLTRVASGVGIWSRENPRFDIDERRVEWTARAERHFGRYVRTGAGVSAATVDFGALDDRQWTIGADAALDTRADPAFPRNAVYLGAGWTGLHVRSLGSSINLYRADARGYLGVFRQIVLAARAQYTAADRTLPPWERLLLGGASNLRGFAAGSFDGDRLAVASAELRAPITSVLSGAKLGLTAFFDAATAYDIGTPLDDARWHRGVGVGVFLIAPLIGVNVDIARGLKTGDTRVHVGMGFAF